jgi:hypothetical protein
MELLFDLERAVEAIEKRVPQGQLLMKVLLSGAVFYGIFFVFHGLWSDCIWPVAQFTATAGTNIVASIRNDSPPHFTWPDVFAGDNWAWIVAGFLLVTLYEFGKRAFDHMSAQIRNLANAVDKYQSIFWRPLGEPEKKELTTKLSALGAHPAIIATVASTDCVELARDLRACFESAGWQVDEKPMNLGAGSMEESSNGLAVWLQQNMGDFNKAVMDALSEAIGGPVTGLLHNVPDQPAVQIVIGHRRIR